MSWPQKSLPVQALIIYFLAVVFTAVFSPLFGKFYGNIFTNIPGGGFGVWGNWWLLRFLQNSFFAWPFFLAFFTMALAAKKCWLVWLIGAVLPFAFFDLGDAKLSTWFIIFTICGFVLGWLVKFIYLKIKK